MATRLRIDGETRGAVNETEALKRALGAVGDVGDRLKRDLRDALSVDSRKGVTEARQMERAVDQVGDQAEKMRRGLRDAFRDVDSRHAVREAKQLDRAIDDVDKSTGRMRSGLGAVGGAAKAGLFALGAGLAAATVGAVKLVDASTDLGEQVNKASTVFGEAADEVIAFSETTDSALGLSQRAALEATGTFGNMLVPMGYARDEAGKMSVEMVKLAADMASFNNASPEQTLAALRSGLAGETEPLRQFGVFLNEARIQAEALDMGLVKQGETLSAAGKAAATYSIIMKDTADTQGDFGRTSDSLANQKRILRAEIENAAASMGQKLIPAAAGAMSAIRGAVPAVKEFGGELAGRVGPAVEAVMGVLRSLAENVLSRIPAVLDSVRAAAGNAFSGWAEYLRAVRPLLEGVFEGVGRLVGLLSDRFGPIVREVGDIAGDFFRRLATVIDDNRAAIERIGERLETALGGAIRAVAWVADTVLLPVLRFVFVELLPRAIGVAITVLDKLTGAIEWVVKRARGIGEAFGDGFHAVRGFVSRAAAGIQDAFRAVFNWVRETALRVYLAILEPFSKLPSRAGGWARRAKEEANAELKKLRIEREWGKDGERDGRAYAGGFTGVAGKMLAAVQVDTGPQSRRTGNEALDVKQRGRAVAAQRGGGGTGPQEINLVGGAAAAPPKPHVIDFVKKVAEVYGGPLTITSGTRHNASTGRGRRSDHADGNAADISTPNDAMNAAVGRAAITAAGGDPSGASGGYYNVGNVQVIFGVSDADGNHFNHVHVGVRGAVGDDKRDTSTTVTPDFSGIDASADTGKKKEGAAKGAAPISPAQKTLREAIGKVVETARGVVKDIPEVERLLLPALERLYEKLGDKALAAKALAGLRAMGADLRHALQNLIRGDELRDRIQNLRATIGTIADDQVRGRLSGQANQLAALWKRLVKDGLTDQELSTFRKRVEAFNTAVSNAFRKDVVDQVERQRGRLNDLFKQGFISEDAYEKASAALDRIPKMIQRALADDGIIGPKERQAIRAQLAEATKIVGEGADQAADAAKKFGRVGDLFRELFTDRFLSDAELGKLRDRAGEVGGKLGEGLQAAVDAVSSARERFRQAWSEFRSAVEAAFREKVVGKFQVFVDVSVATLDNARVDDELADSLADWKKIVRDGLTGVNAELYDALEENRDAWADYYEAVRNQDQAAMEAAIARIVKSEDDIAQLREAGLDEQGQAILRGGERLINATKAVGDRVVEETKRGWEAAQTEALGRVMAYVDEVGGQLERGEISWGDAMRRIAGKLQEEGMAAGDAMELLSGRTDSAMGKAALALQTAADAMTTAIDALLKFLGASLETAGQIAARMSGYAGQVAADYARIIDMLDRTNPLLNPAAPGAATATDPAVYGPGGRRYQHGTAFVEGPPGIDEVAARLTRGEMVFSVDQVGRLGAWLRNLIRGFGGWRALPLGARDQMRGMFPAGALPRLLGGGMDALPPRGRPFGLSPGPLPLPRWALRLPVEQMAVGGVAGDQTPLRGPMSNSWLVSSDAVRVNRSALPGSVHTSKTVVYAPNLAFTVESRGGDDEALARRVALKVRDELELHRRRNGWLFGGDT